VSVTNGTSRNSRPSPVPGAAPRRVQVDVFLSRQSLPSPLLESKVDRARVQNSEVRARAMICGWTKRDLMAQVPALAYVG
jgi:hypothetical protein